MLLALLLSSSVAVALLFRNTATLIKRITITPQIIPITVPVVGGLDGRVGASAAAAVLYVVL